MNAVDLVAEKGWSMLPQYQFTRETGEWQHHEKEASQEWDCLSKIDYSSGKLSYPGKTDKKNTAFVLDEAILKAKEIMK